ncbi:BYST-like protein [Mya arenaria]|uniref:BYST-like protein n=1 Tax=Mya arenaria TaxID=6604 RepID=A0ABY7F5P9_MYAAR|nr:BYST-like protein [Mya arenaria]
MGKMKKTKTTRQAGVSLADQVLEDGVVKPTGRLKSREKTEKDDEFVDDKLSRKILEQARQQQEDLEEEHGIQRRTLADIIQEKLTEKKTEIQSHMTDNASVQLDQLEERLVAMYKSIRQILQRYRSGKLPKAFKVIPGLRNWEQALKKSLFKPAAFFKGILLPLCEAGNCTLREAVILSSVLVKNSIPMLHSAAALLKIAEMDYNGANSIFIRALLDKKYALPYRVRYKEDISSEQKEALMEVLRAHTHEHITPEVRRELVNSKCRDLETSEPSAGFAEMDD